VPLPNGRRAFLDFAWPDLRLGVEADGYRHHASRVDWARDHTRNNALTSLGWRILPVTWEDMVHRPDQLVALLRRARAA
jgi:very-short-patch-repair endonuclease